MELLRGMRFSAVPRQTITTRKRPINRYQSATRSMGHLTSIKEGGSPMRLPPSLSVWGLLVGGIHSGFIGVLTLLPRHRHAVGTGQIVAVVQTAAASLLAAAARLLTAAHRAASLLIRTLALILILAPY